MAEVDGTNFDLVIRGRRIALPDGIRPARIGIRDGRVVEVDDHETGGSVFTATRVIDLADDEVLLPGLVDTHVHVNQPGRTEWEGFATATDAAAAGGVTTILDMPLNSIPATTSVEALETKRDSARDDCRVDVGFWGGAVPDSLGHLEKLHRAGVFGFKCFLLDSGVPEFPPLDATQLRSAMTEIAAFDGLLIVHAEDAPTIEQHRIAHALTYAEFLGSRPSEAETTAITQVIEACRATGCRTHIVHLSSAAALPDVAAAKAEGLPLTVETCPHYLTLAAEDIPDGQTQFKCCPPVRDSSNADKLWAALGDGTIDFVVSDHSPSTPELKFAGDGDFAVAWGGIASLQLGLPLVWTEAARRGYTLDDVVGWMASGPAHDIRVPDKGAIAIGFDADLVVFAPEESFVVDKDALRHRNPVSPYHGRTLSGVVRRTLLRGAEADLDCPRRGRLLSAEPTIV